jgi:hypothetical protein
MDTLYAQTVRLLLAVAPDVFANEIFAMKGGTAINLFVQNMHDVCIESIFRHTWADSRINCNTGLMNSSTLKL